MKEGILNEPVRESAEHLLKTFGEQMRVPFTNLIFIAIAPDGTFRTANCSSEKFVLTKEAVEIIAKHLIQWGQTLEG